MQINSTGDMRRFLAKAMQDVSNGQLEAGDAKAIATLAGQINNSLSLEISAAMRTGEAVQITLNGQTTELASDGVPQIEADKDGMVWCEQCDGRVLVEDVGGCKSRFCSLKPQGSIDD